MIFNASNEDLDPKPKVLAHLRDKKYARVIDIGGAMGSWADEFVTHYVDMNDCPRGKRTFVGDLCDESLWEKVYRSESDYKFDFAICTQTLEDLRSPQVVLRHLPLIAKRGYIDVPNKWMELRKGTEHRYQADWDALGIYGPYRGYCHHRHFFGIQDGTLVIFPKLNFLDQLKAIDDMLPPPDWTFRPLSFWWEGDLPFRTFNNDFMGPSAHELIAAYLREIPKGL